MSTMVEKVARAIDPEVFRCEDIAKRFLASAKRNWDGSMEKTVHEAKIAEAFLRAIAAIEAMAEPTGAMIKAGEDNVDGTADVSYVFTAMIQAALKEEAQ